MLKGITQIELTEARTGKKEISRQENMVTDALSNILRPLGIVNSEKMLGSEWMPYYKTLLGGLLLFDRALPEDPAAVYPPGDAVLTGCGVYGEQNTTAGSLRGGFNLDESTVDLTGRQVKYVYDFKTSEANGVIASVCLTHKNGGYSSYGGADTVKANVSLGLKVGNGVLQYCSTDFGHRASTVTLGQTELLFLMDRENDTAYYFRIDGPGDIHIRKRRAGLRSVSVLDSCNTRGLIGDIPVTLPQALPTQRFAYNYDHADRSLYIFAAADTSRVAPNQSITVTRLPFGSWQPEQFVMVNTSGRYLHSASGAFAFAHDGRVYIRDYNNYHHYSIALENAADIIDLGARNPILTPLLAVNGRVFWYYYYNNDNNTRIWVSRAGDLLAAENSYFFGNGNYYMQTWVPFLDEPMLYWSQGSGGNFVILNNYLATVSNLQHPLTKTADKTMKVTYILQEQ